MRRRASPLLERHAPGYSIMSCRYSTGYSTTSDGGVTPQEGSDAMPKQPRGKRVSAATRVQAEVRRNEKLDEIDDAPRVASRFSRDTTVAELIEWWLESFARHQAHLARLCGRLA
jgi:hypothetical protein